MKIDIVKGLRYGLKKDELLCDLCMATHISRSNGQGEKENGLV